MSEKQQLEGGAYEVIRTRLLKSGEDLRARLESLNTSRKEVFGAVETELVSTERITTDHHCIPRDMIPVGEDHFLFGYNIQFGLKKTTNIEDIFSVYHYEKEEHVFHRLELEDFLGAPAFKEDFEYVFRYYKNASFIKFMTRGAHLYMVMRVGHSLNDIKTFKWLIGEGPLEYLGNRFDHEYQYPDQQEFEWVRAHRDMHRSGEHPHISVEDRLFVETIKGDLTIKIEDNTSTGKGIYAEAVTDFDQSLDDAEVFYAVIGPIILLKILPYREELYRYLAYNEKTKTVHRLDAIGESCVLLPDDQGLIFANGYYLTTGEVKVFENELIEMYFEKRLPSANGEDFLYVFYNRKSGVYVLLSYNLITRKVEAPVLCHGYSVFGSGEMLYFRTEEQPQKHHAIQVWQTSFLDDDAMLSAGKSQDGFLYKVGNTDLVRGMAECREVLTLLQKEDNYEGLYYDLTQKSGEVIDSYFWLSKEECFELKTPLESIRKTSQSAIDEFEKVQSLRQAHSEELNRVGELCRDILRKVKGSPPDGIFGFVSHLSDLRGSRGEVIGLKELRYVDAAKVQEWESQLQEATEKTSQQTVDFLLKPEALTPYADEITKQKTAISKIEKVTQADDIAEQLSENGEQLEMLIEVISNLKIEDATQTTKIIEDASNLYSTLNTVRAELKKARYDLAKEEGAAQFGAQMKLLSQSVVNFLDLSDTVERCESYQTKLMVQVEELEGRFSEFEDYLDEIHQKREEVHDAFEGKKQALLDQKTKRARQLLKSAERVLNGVRNRAGQFAEINEINGYFASDLMVEKVREVIAELQGLNESVSADGLQAQLKTIREDSVRQLKDRKELFVEGENIIQFGKHAFSVNTQDLELSIVPKEEGLYYHLSGTHYYEDINHEKVSSSHSAWGQEIVSENAQVYRAEWLAYQYLQDDLEGGPVTLESVQEYMQPRYQESYTKGVHDQDAYRILMVLKPLHQELGAGRYSPLARALGVYFWSRMQKEESGKVMVDYMKAHSSSRKKFGSDARNLDLLALLKEGVEKAFVELSSVWSGSDDGVTAEAAEYLYEVLSEGATLVMSAKAGQILAGFSHELTAKRANKEFEERLSVFEGNPAMQLRVSLDWLRSFVQASGILSKHLPMNDWLWEVAVQLVTGEVAARNVSALETDFVVNGLMGSHRQVRDGGLSSNYYAFREKMRSFKAIAVPAYEELHELKHELIEEKKEALKLDEFKPRVMSSFVRNQLINEVYLPLIGENFAKQLGAAGADTRTDRMGLLLLVSPPGYGKTTLMEYVASRLGVTFVKINGPALGHEVVSLDPDEAPNLSAREEVKKLNLAFEMGDNVLIYLDDIQHTNPELLQKFISLCDGQRKVEGVFNGKAKTYDLRGRKVGIVMAGNPYTETGGKFQIPDMLANRADTYNLGDILGGHASVFEASYIENCLTSNEVLSKLASRSQKDVYAIMQIAREGSSEGVDFEGNYSPAEIEEMVTVMKHLSIVRDRILRVNLEYIRSAAQEDAYRTEPAFKLQGSYRNMNRIAAKVVPLMTPEEVKELVIDHYESESQTLTTGAEANLLKFREMEGICSPEEEARWEEIKKEFVKQKLLGGSGENDPVARVVAQLSELNGGLSSMSSQIAEVAKKSSQPQALADETVKHFREAVERLWSVPVEVRMAPVQEEKEKEG